MDEYKSEINPDGAAFASSHGISDDDEFFMDNTFVVILVQNKFFRVPISKLKQESKIFAEKFAPLFSVDSGGPGSSRKNPIDLSKESSAAEFKLLLRLLFASNDCSEPSNQQPSFSKEDWFSILKLATLWNFPCIRHKAIRHLTQTRKALTPLEQIEWCRTYSIVGWLESGYKEPVRRQQMIQPVEVEFLVLEIAFKLSQLRETYKDAEMAGSHRPWPGGSSSTRNISENEVLGQCFKEELEEVKLKQKTYWDSRMDKMVANRT